MFPNSLGLDYISLSAQIKLRTSRTDAPFRERLTHTNHTRVTEQLLNIHHNNNALLKEVMQQLLE
ncbi:UNVERIFIED_CONTAM: hypothetical protein FKN15_075291 [Acipenser sinensis]